MTRPVPQHRHVAPVASDVSPLVGTGRGNELATALLGDLESEAERRSALYVELNPKSNEACQALSRGDRETAARLFDELAQAWLDAGFASDASGCAALAHSARNPKPVAPKTIGRANSSFSARAWKPRRGDK